MTAKLATLTLQKWGNSLAVRIPATMARSAHFQVGTPVVLAMEKNAIVIRSTGEPKLTLDERLKRFDPEKHGSEAMVLEQVGLEKF